MAKKDSGIYAPGELGRVREKLGVKDAAEAKRMMQVLGGEVGTERSDTTDKSRTGKNKVRRETVEVEIKGRRGRRIDMSYGDEDDAFSNKPKEPYPGDDPSVPPRLSYRDRVKIDQLAGQFVFEIKNSMQVFTSVFSIFKEPEDFVNPVFVTKRMSEYYGKVEKLVTSTRNIFPKNNTRRNNQLKRANAFVFRILDILRSWNIEELAKNIAALQTRPRAVKVTDFADILRGIYRPLFLLDDLNMENIKSAFKLLYKILYIESPMAAKDQYQDVIRTVISSLGDVRKNVHFGLYPLLMKLISDSFFHYDRFFIERERRYMAFLNVTQEEQLNAVDLSPQQIESINAETLQSSPEDDIPDEPDEGAVLEETEDPNDPKVIERKAKEDAEKAETKALEQGIVALESLFPKANWNKLEEFPDFYPYFANVYSMRSGYELIAPTDPLQQVSVLMNIMDDLFIGMRYINFGTVTGPDGNLVKVSDELYDILNHWRRYIEDSFSKDYLPRLTEYCRLLENSKESRSSAYARKTINELHWIKRLYFFPYYKFESIGPPPFSKQDIIPIYSLIRKIRKILTAVAMGIEQTIRRGGAANKLPCNGIHNPWERYNFQVPNPVSKRMDMLLHPEKRINATLIFFTLSVVTVMDYIINNEKSWAYGGRPGPLFRSSNNEGITPVFGVDEKLDADKIFKDVLKKRQAAQSS